MTILSALKKLHKKMTGQDTDSKTIGGILDSMQENYSGGSGGGDTYETITETIGSSEKDGELYFSNFINDDVVNIKTDSEVKLNGLNLIPIPDAGSKPSFYLNLNLDTFIPTGTPAYFVEIENSMSGSGVTIGCDTDISGKIITLEYKSSGDGSLPDPGAAGNVLTSTGEGWESAAPSDDDYPVTAVLTAGESGFAITQVSKSTLQIKSAYDAGKTVHLVIDGSILGATLDLPLTEIASDDQAWFVGEISFGGVIPAVIIVEVNADADPEMAFVELPPAFDATDIGKLLGLVSDGKGDAIMSWLSPSALSNDYKITLAADASTGTITTTDGKTLSDILAACDADKNVYAVLNITLGAATIHQRYALGTWMSNRVEFYRTEVEDSGGTPTAKPVCIYCQDLGSGDVWEPVD